MFLKRFCLFLAASCSLHSAIIAVTTATPDFPLDHLRKLPVPDIIVQLSPEELNDCFQHTPHLTYEDQKDLMARLLKVRGLVSYWARLLVAQGAVLYDNFSDYSNDDSLKNFTDLIEKIDFLSQKYHPQGQIKNKILSERIDINPHSEDLQYSELIVRNDLLKKSMNIYFTMLKIFEGTLEESSILDLNILLGRRSVEINDSIIQIMTYLGENCGISPETHDHSIKDYIQTLHEIVVLLLTSNKPTK